MNIPGYLKIKICCLVFLLSPVNLAPAYSEDLFEDLFFDGVENKEIIRAVDRRQRKAMRRFRSSKLNRMSLIANQIGKESYSDYSMGIATSKLNPADIRYIQTSPQSTINDTLKFVPGVRGGNF